MPSIAGLHHTSLTVSDVDASVDWYRDVLGFTVLFRRPAGELDKAMLERADAGIRIVLVGHGAHAVDARFDEHRAGLDHIGFAVADRAALEEWAARLDAHDVPRSAIAAGSSGELIAFRDPDNIALEFYTLA